MDKQRRMMRYIITHKLIKFSCLSIWFCFTFIYPSKYALADSSSPPSENIIVTGKRIANGSTAITNVPEINLGPLGTMNAEDAPFSILSVSHDVIVNQQARNVNDLMKYLPSLQLEARGNAGTSRPQSRGFEADVVANSRLDGLNFVTTTPYAAEMFENVQVLNGLTGALYGPQNPAGTFLYQLKRPTDKRINNFAFGVDSMGTVMEHADLSGRIGKNKWFGYRLNLLHGDGTGYVDHSWIRRNLISGDFDIHLSENTVIEIDASHYTYDERGTAPGFSYNNLIQLPSAPDTSKPYLGQDYAGFNNETNTFLSKIKHNFNENWNLTLGGLYQDAKRKSFANANSFTNSLGDYTQTITASSAAKDFVVGSNFGYLNGKIKTWFMTHDVLLGTNGYRMSNYNPTKTESFLLGTSNIRNPQAFPGYQPKMSGRYLSAFTQQQALITGDTIHFDDRWSILGVLSWNWLSTTNHAVNGAIKSRSSESGVFNPMTGLVYHPIKNHTAYFTWGRSIQQGSTAPSTGVTNPNETLSPFRSEQYEVGYKIKMDKALLSVAAFRMTRPYAFIDPTTSVYSAEGTQRNYGVEFQASGEVYRNLSVLGGVTWLDPQIGNTGNAQTSHKQVVGVPPVQANILLDYRLPVSETNIFHGLAFNASLHYTDRRAANNYNTTFANAYFTTDLGTRYVFRLFDKSLIARFTVNNVTNKHYWLSVYPTSINGGSGNNSAYAGLPRTYQFTIEVNL